MPATSCHSCRKLISDKDSHCPFCKAPQTIQRESRALTKSYFNEPGEVITWIVGINVLLFGASILLDSSEALSMDRGLLGFGSPTMRSLYLLGMTGGSVWTCGHWWTVLTASFLHGSILHIYFNLSWLRQLGVLTVGLLGPARFIFAYLATGIGGFVASNIWHNAPTVGASCSIFGLMGLLIVFAQRRGGLLGQRLGKQLWIWTGIGLLFGLMVPMVNNAGHIGGLLTGMLLGFIFPKHENRQESGVLQLIALAMLGSTILFVGYNGLIMSQMLEQFDLLGQIFCR
jgi:rhomboid protease GluP